MKKLTFHSKASIALDLLEQEMEIIGKEYQVSYKGGSSGYGYWSNGYYSSGVSSSGYVTEYLSQVFGRTVYSSVDGYGNWVISVGSSGWIPLTFQLNEVNITANGNVFNSSGYSYYTDWNNWLNPFYSSGNFDFSQYGGGEGGASSGAIYPSDMTESYNTVNFIAGAESFSSTVYTTDGGGNATIGYGHKLTQQEINDGTYTNRTITETEAKAILAIDMQTAISSVQRNVDVPLTQYQFDALVSFAYQQGSTNFANSSVNTLINDGDYTAAAEALRHYSDASADGRVHRRGEEADLFTSGDYTFSPY